MDARNEFSLRDYLVVLRRQRWLIVAAAVIVAGVVTGVSLTQTPQYQAQTDLALERLRPVGDVTLEGVLSPSGPGLETERLFMTSRAVADRVADELGLADHRAALQGVDVSAVSGTRVLRISATNADPDAAVARANTFASAYLDARRDQAVDDVLAARANLEERAGRLRSEIAARDADLEAGAGAQEETLTLEREALVAQLGQVVDQTSQFTEFVDSVVGGGSVLNPAEVPSETVSSDPLTNAAVGVILGLALGIGLAFVRDYFDDVVRDEAEFKRATGGLPVLGRIPKVDGEDGADRPVTIVNPADPASEAYRELSAATRFMLLTHGDDRGGDGAGHTGNGAGHTGGDGQAPGRGRSLLLVSATLAEGKTETAANLAVAAARVGLDTVLVDADLRKATLARRFGLARTTGLSDVLLTGEPVSRHLQEVGVDNLRLLPAGTSPPNPAELLASGAMRALQDRLVSTADLVIYDSPAVLAVPDALELGRFVDLALLVGRPGLTSRRQIQAALERLEQVGTSLPGTVLNALADRGEGYYAYYYTSYYGEDRAAGEDEAEPVGARNSEDPTSNGRAGSRNRR